MEKKQCLRPVNYSLTSMVIRPKGSPSAVMSKKTFGRLILPVGGLDFVEYDRTEANPPANECFWAKQCWNCRRVNKRNVVDAIVVGVVRFLRLCGATTPTTSKENGNSTGRWPLQHCTAVREQCVGGAGRRRRVYGYRGNVWYLLLYTYCSAGCRTTDVAALPALSTARDAPRLKKESWKRPAMAAAHCRSLRFTNRSTTRRHIFTRQSHDCLHRSTNTPSHSNSNRGVLRSIFRRIAQPLTRTEIARCNTAAWHFVWCSIEKCVEDCDRVLHWFVYCNYWCLKLFVFVSKRPWYWYIEKWY